MASALCLVTSETVNIILKSTINTPNKKFDIFSNFVYTRKNKRDSSIAHGCDLNCPRTQMALDFRANFVKKSRLVQCLQGFVGNFG